MSGRCDTCKHWVRRVVDRGLFPGYGRCMLSESMTNARFKQIELVCFDDEGFLGKENAYLLTKPGFGCVQHEARGT